MESLKVNISINCSSETGNWYAKVKDNDANQKEIIFFQRDAKPGIWQAFKDYITGVKAGELVAREYLSELGIGPDSEVNIAGAAKLDAAKLTNEGLNQIFQYASKRLSAGLSLENTGAPTSRTIHEKNERVEISINRQAVTHEPFESQQAYKARLVDGIKELLQKAKCKFNEAELKKAVDVAVDVDTLVNPKKSLAEMHRAQSYLTQLIRQANSIDLNLRTDFLIETLNEKIQSSRNDFNTSILDGYRYCGGEQPFTLDGGTKEDWKAKLELIFDLSEQIADLQKFRNEDHAKTTLQTLKTALWEFEHPNVPLRTTRSIELAEGPLAELKRRMESCKALLKSLT